MSLNFLNPNLLWLLALAAVPVLLHLFARSKPPVYSFSSVAFLRKIIRKTMRFRKPQDILLLVLRTLAVLALAGAFLRPLLFTQEKLSGLFQSKSLVAIVDATASMACVEGAQTRFAAACAETSELLAGLSSRDRANIVWLKSEPDSVFPGEPASNLGYLRDQLRRAEVTSESGAPGEAFALALDMLSEIEGKREICVVSDFQRSAWESFSPEAPEGIDVIHVRIGRREAANRAVTRLSHEPAAPVIGEEITVHAEVRNFSPDDVETTVFAEIGEGRQSRNLSLPADGALTLTFHHTAASAGPLPVRVSLAEDSFPGDDTRRAVIPVRPHLRVATVAGEDAETARIWTRAAQALEWAVPEWISLPENDAEAIEGWDVMLFSGVAPPDASSIPASTKVVCLPPANSPFRFSSPRNDGEPRESRVLLETKEDPGYSVRLTDQGRRAFPLFSGDQDLLPGGLAGHRRLRLADTPEGSSLLAYSDGAPALLRVASNRYLWLAPLSDESGNLAARAEFLPLFGEFLLADRRAGSEHGLLGFEPGQPVLWKSPEPLSPDHLRLVSANGQEFPFQAGEGKSFEAAALPAPGLYEWNTLDGPVGYTVVNFPASESNLAALSLEETRASASVAVSEGGQVRQLRDGLPLWPWLLCAAVCLFIAESAVALWAGRTA